MRALRLGGLRDVAANGDGFASGCCNAGDYVVRASLAGGVVDDYRSALSSERLGDGGSDTLGCAGNNRDFTCELTHVLTPLSVLRRTSAILCGRSRSVLLGRWTRGGKDAEVLN